MMRQSNSRLTSRSFHHFFRVASPSDQNAYKARVEFFKMFMNSKETASALYCVSSQSNHQFFTNLKSFAAETPYIPPKMSTVISDLLAAGVKLTEADVMYALQTVGDTSQTTEPLIFEKSPSEVDAVWGALPPQFRRESPLIQYHYLKYTSNCYHALVIIENWFAHGEQAKKKGIAVQSYFPLLKTDFISSLIAEASSRLQNAFEFSIFLTEEFVRSRNETFENTDGILFRYPIPTSSMSALFLTVSNGRELKSLIHILDAQLQLTSHQPEQSVTYSVILNEALVETILFSCSGATDYKHRLDIAQTYFRRYKDDCELKRRNGIEENVTMLMYESLMYIAADVGEIDVHKSILSEASGSACRASNTTQSSAKLLDGQVENANPKGSSLSTIQHLTHLIALVRAGYLADALLTLDVMHENEIPLPVYAFQIIMEGIGSVARTKNVIIDASCRLGPKVHGKAVDMMNSYTHLPRQYHNGFQMLQELLKTMNSFGIDIKQSSSFIDYSLNIRKMARVPKGTYFSVMKTYIDTLTQLGVHSKTHLQNFHMANPSQYSIDMFCQLARNMRYEEMFQSVDVSFSALLLFLLRCYPTTRKEPRKEDTYILKNANFYRIPTQELIVINQINKDTFRAIWKQKSEANELIEARVITEKAARFATGIRKIVPKTFIYPSLCIMEKVYEILSPIVFTPLSFGSDGDPSFSLGSSERLQEYLHSSKAENRTVVIPFSFSAHLHHTFTSHNGALGNDKISATEFIDTFISWQRSQQIHHVWYVTLDQELLIRSYSKRRRASLDYTPKEMDVTHVLNLCCLDFIDGLSELLEACAGGRQMPISVYTGIPDESKTMYLEKKLWRKQASIEIM